MNAILWIIVGGLIGWLTGISLGEKGYGKVLSMGCTRSLDMFFGVAGAAIGHYTLFWTVVGRGLMLSIYGAIALSAIALVVICRLVSEHCFRSPSHRGMFRGAFIEWHDTLTVKELANWKARRAAKSKSKSPAA